MKMTRLLTRDERGAATIEMAFAVPIFVVMVYMFFQFAQMYRALSGIQQGLGEGARYATLCLTPTSSGCTIPDKDSIKAKINASVYGIGPGVFSIDDPSLKTASAGGKYYDLTVRYTQHTSLLLFPGPDISISRSKRVWVATT